ncbi:MAG TPA: sugar ABC transporter permease, partial [Phototrophicaceae bacterium]|nr:sugar ABC transporter permease [Phototrophicaceae bacterium]
MSVSTAKPTSAQQGRAVADIPRIMKQGRWTPWVYLAPALVVMLIFIVYPTINTLILSFRNKDGSDWATAACQSGQSCWGILENYHYALTNDVMLQAFANNIFWLLFMVSGCVLFGLLIALLANKVKYESIAKSIIFLPMAISFVGAGVIWKFVYSYNASGAQIGILNALVVALGGQPVAWLTQPQVNTIALIVVGVWMSTGFCMVITSAAIKNVPADILEAANVDGANAFQSFWNVTLPTIMPTLIV